MVFAVTQGMQRMIVQNIMARYLYFELLLFTCTLAGECQLIRWSCFVNYVNFGLL